MRAREWTTVGFTMMRPSLMSFFTCVRELALPISDCSLGSSQIFRLPTPATDAASRFCERRLTIVGCLAEGEPGGKKRCVNGLTLFLRGGLRSMEGTYTTEHDARARIYYVI